MILAAGNNHVMFTLNIVRNVCINRYMYLKFAEHLSIRYILDVLLALLYNRKCHKKCINLITFLRDHYLLCHHSL